MNLETRQAYHQMFTETFRVLKEVSRSSIKFAHITPGQGLRTITADMDMKQAPGKPSISYTYTEYMLTRLGFGDFLHNLDPEREWDEHLQHMLVFCQVHVKRNFRKKHPNHAALYVVGQIWEAKTIEELEAKMDSISSVYPELKSWINSKKAPWILAGLTPETSKVPTEWWDYARKHTGAGESSHFSDNTFAGRKLTMLKACLR